MQTILNIPTNSASWFSMHFTPANCKGLPVGDINIPPKTLQAARTATSACGGELKLSGELQCCVSFRGTTFVGSCYITATELNLFGLDWFDRHRLADIPSSIVCNAVQSPTAHPDHASDIIKRYPIVFQSSLGFSNLAVSRLMCFLLVTWQLRTEGVTAERLSTWTAVSIPMVQRKMIFPRGSERLEQLFGVGLSVKGLVYNAAARSILLYGSETWSLRSEDLAFDRRRLRRIV
ncbi:hypothetical protein T265_00240 [Opisthorchis viverrini]|uniref:Uncharacterized protein n=1 Tax=Opisthorchis viverrini TaxID=6198 RepID=A0A075A6R4_OPIVI|nr:hypothetical protein T265_00240 [Opisthorchis viverrini]KER34062.1 hypothetical protein T265_00240 [Opisthorchis viverrini]